MLDGRDDDVIAGIDHAQEREVVSLGAAAGEDDFRGKTVEQRGNSFAGQFQMRQRAPAATVNGRGVAKGLREARKHLFQNFRENGGGAVVVEV